MRKSLLICLVILLSAFYTKDALAQKNVKTQELLWTRFALEAKLSENYQIHQELEERTYWFPWRQHQFLSRTYLRRELGKGWNAGLGFTYFLQALPNDPEITDYTNRTELRPQLEIAYKQILSEKIELHHRYWSEFRFFEKSDNAFEYGNNRTRYKLELRYALTPKITLKAFDEIHINLGNKIVQNVFNQNRYGGSLLYMLKDNFGVELGYLNWFQQQESGVDFYNRHILRFTVRYAFSGKKSRS
ncbi:DUF2490 domain-containing protein [Psychroflexus sp. YR1-1]|uniref:DUF2490 domain-containing protein n=1 Tax=Psychroflexus aurantiacus TaxID=2709310 RepID=A0A6B3R6C6_9FLAO|nr:DUF2490 domain-containing protein [Psychroflexus aurantiacus]NEV94677.1 DUF2490 domain-containing protein [Psychroflexus aurantiacus]